MNDRYERSCFSLKLKRWNREQTLWDLSDQKNRRKRNSVSQTWVLMSDDSTNETVLWRRLPVSWCEVEEGASWITVTKHSQARDWRQRLEMGECRFSLHEGQILFLLFDVFTVTCLVPYSFSSIVCGFYFIWPCFLTYMLKFCFYKSK